MRSVLAVLFLLACSLGLALAAPNGLLQKPGQARSAKADPRVREIVNARQLTKQKLIDNLAERATATGQKKRQTSPVPKRPFAIALNSGSTTTVYTLNDPTARSTTLLSGNAASTNVTFAIGGATNTGPLITSNPALRRSGYFVVSTAGTETVRFADSLTTADTGITCTVDTTTAGPVSVPLVCRNTNTGAPLQFCAKSGRRTMFISPTTCSTDSFAVTLTAIAT